MKVEVTAEDIAKGTPYSQDSCAIAQSLRRLGLRCVTVVPAGAIRWEDGDGNKYAARTPDEARTFALRYDRDERVDPITFELEPVSVPRTGEEGT